MPTDPSSAAARVRAGATLGLLLSLAVVVPLVAVLLLGGPEVHLPRYDTLLRVDLAMLCVLVGAVASGALGGALWPLLRRRLVAVPAGALVVAPVSFAMQLPFDRAWAQWGFADTVLALLLALVSGGGMGYAISAAPFRERWVQRRQRITSRVHPRRRRRPGA